MKCFRIDEGGEHFYYAAETAEMAMAEYRENNSDEFEGAEIREVTEEEMASITVAMEDENEHLSGTSTLKQVFDDEAGGTWGVAIQLCGSVY